MAHMLETCLFLLEEVLQWYRFNAGNLNFVQYFNVCCKVTPVNIEDGAETSLVIALEETYVTAVGDSSL